MKNMNKPVAFTMAAFFFAGSVAFAEDSTMIPPQTTPRSLSETTNSSIPERETRRNLANKNRMAKKHMDYEGAMKSIPHATIAFDNGSAALSESARASLRELVQDVRATGTIDQVTVAAWSDKSLPVGKKDLSEADRDLASKRADAISSVLKTELEVSDVDTYNMAERANWLARTFHTRQAELKSIFGKKGAETPVTNAEFHVIKNEGGPAAAVVVVEKEVR